MHPCIHAGIEGVFPVKLTPQQTAELVTGFDGEVTSLTLRFRWELDMAAGSKACTGGGRGE